MHFLVNYPQHVSGVFVKSKVFPILSKIIQDPVFV